MATQTGQVKAVALSPTHEFSKQVVTDINLLAGLGIDGDAHKGKTVMHRSRVAKDPGQPNLRQVHLIHTELHAELLSKGFELGPGVMGENITTQGINLLVLPRKTRLHIGEKAVLEVTGLRNPCRQLNDYQAGLMQAVLDRAQDGSLVRKAGIMAIVIVGGRVRTRDKIKVHLPPLPHEKLERV